MASSPDKTINTDIPEKDVFTLHFIQSLSNLRTRTPLNSPDTTNYRARKIKKAAYVSMAKVAGGSSRLWSRALLRRAKNKMVRFSRRKRKVTWKISSKRSNQRAPVVEEATERLRNLVPGGGEMETLKLMEETAHYIKCLSMQVKVMQCLVDGLSPE